MPRAEQLWNSFAWSAAPNGRSQEKARVQITGHWRIAIPASPRSSNFVFPMFRFRGGELARAHFDISSTMQARTLVESASMLLDASRSPLQVVLQSPQRSRAVLCYAKRPLLIGVREALGVISVWGLVAAVVLDEFPALGLLNQKVI